MSKEVSTDWKKAMAQQVATKAEAAEETGIPHISLRHGRMTLNDSHIPDDELQCIIIGSRIERTWYDRAYDPDDQGPPECFALAEKQSELVPHDNVPNPPASQCKGCPMAEFGTAKQGKGPACKTRLRLLVVPAPNALKPAHLKNPEMAILKVSPTSVVNFNGLGRNGKAPGYERVLAEKGITPWAVISKVMVRPHSKKMHEVTFSLVKPLDEDALLAASYALSLKAPEILESPYSYPDEGEESSAPDHATMSGAKY